MYICSGGAAGRGVDHTFQSLVLISLFFHDDVVRLHGSSYF